MNVERNLSIQKKRSASILLILALCSSIVYAATQSLFDSVVNVSDSVAASQKGRLARLAYVDIAEFVKPVLVVYIDASGTPGSQFNVALGST